MDLSEPRLISPMLDDFAMGAPISNHHGVRCCPAMRNDSDKKYIVKMISIPASQVQLDAFLLTGAYKNGGEALAYFKTLADDVVKEVGILNKLAKLEGFLPIEDHQIVPMENGEIGLDVYLLSTYRKSLARFFRKHTMTHLNAVNLGLDLCAALAVCRRAGYLYADLKPENVFISEDKEYRIGDLGFLELSSLKYASLPEKYRSAYTAPEIQDAMSAINTTIDVYAAGLILYQAYNDGHLPFDGQAPQEPLPAPDYADYEMAEIILRACAPKPEDRWKDPIEMGQAIVSYMQRNGADDVPIVPPVVATPAPAEEAPANPLIASAVQAEEEDRLQLDELKKMLAEPEDEPASPDTSQADPDDPANLSFMNNMVDDETAPAEEMASQIAYEDLSEDANDILALADDLIAHDAPEPVIPPEKIDVPIPPPISIPEQPTAEEAAPEENGEAVSEEPSEAVSEETEDTVLQENAEEASSEPTEPRKKPVGKIIGITAAVLLAIGLAIGGFFFFTKYYLQNIRSISLHSTEDRLTVQIDSDIGDGLLRVVCTDTYGNRQVADVIGGKADFSGLGANTLYTLRLEISGFHKLTGTTNANYTTPEKCDVVSFSAVAGTEDGSVILTFTTSGIEPDNWYVSYFAEGEPERKTPVTGRTAALTGLTIGKEYTFTLGSESPVYITGQSSLNYTVPKIIYAENLTIDSCTGSSLSAVWTVPEGQRVESWTVRCYNDSGFDQTMEVTQPNAVFTDLDSTKAYHVEVVAKGMTGASHTEISANSITVTSTNVEILNETDLRVSWTFDGPAPQGSWHLYYTVDGSTAQDIVQSDQNQIVIENYIPGATYQFTLKTESGTTVFRNTFTASTPEASKFSGYLVTSDNMHFRMCNTPDKENWDRFDLTDSDYTAVFSANGRASFLVQMDTEYNESYEVITALFVIRDASGMPVSHRTTAATWYDMWLKYYCELDIPALPQTPGDYTIEVYFNGHIVHEQTFQII